MKDEEPVTDDTRATRLVNEWIDKHRLWLKDPGGPNGVHKVPKEALIAMIIEALQAQRGTLPPPLKPSGKAGHHLIKPSARSHKKKVEAEETVDEA